MLNVKLQSALIKVFPDEEPCGEIPARLSMLKNERLSFQLAISSDADTEVSLAVSSALANDMNIYCVECTPSLRPVSENHDDFILRSEPGNYPDLLRPLNGAFSVKGGEWRSVWFEVVPDGGFEAGSYPVEIKLSASDGDDASARIDLDIINASLPEQELICTNWFHTDCLSTWYKVPVFSEEYWSITEKYVKAAVDHGINFILTPLFTPPLDTAIGSERPTVQLVDVYADENGYTFGFDRLDRWIRMCERCSVKYFEMSHLFTQWGAWKTPKIIADTPNGQKQIFGWKTWASSKKYTDFLTSFARALIEFIDEKGIRERCFFHISDEPSEEVLHVYKKRSALIKSIFPGFRIIDALSNVNFYKKGLLECPVACIDHAENFYGLVPRLWTYYCCGPSNGYFSNRFFSMPSQRTRVLGLQLFKYDAEGFLQWGYNFWYSRLSVREINPFETSDGDNAFPSGDPYVVYPGEDGSPLFSLRLKVFYDAFQDLRALRLLESLEGREKALAVLSAGLENELTFSSYPHGDAWLLAKREEINSAIALACR